MMYRELTEKLDPPEAPPSKEDVAEIATKE
jgi:hypothetical protein